MNGKSLLTVKFWIVVSMLGLGLWWMGSHTVVTQAEPAAPTVTVLSPSGIAADTIGEGDDYFTQVLHDPRDMNQHTDLTWQEFGIHNISFSNGIWSATTSNTPSGSYAEIYALYPGFSHASDVGVAEVGKTGWNYPIQTAKYKQLSFRLKAPAGASAVSNWWHASYTNLSFTVESGHVEGDYIAPDNNWQTYLVNFASKPDWSTGPKYGISFRFGLVTGNYQFDWLRLTDPATSPEYTIRFSVAGVQSGDVVDLYCYTAPQIVADNSCGQIAANIAVNTATTYNYVWKTAYLPPGAYYVYAVVRSGALTGSDVSNGPLTIKPAPTLDFVAPSMTSGPDYATDVLGNPWDMNDESDIFTASDLYRKPHDFVSPCPCFSNGELYGTVQRLDPATPPEFSDPLIYLRVNRNNPIDTSKYKYLTYRFKIDRTPWWPSSNDRLAWDSTRNVYPAAWLARLIAFGTFPPDIAASSDSTKAIIVFDDWNTYQMDLSQGVARGYWDPTTPLTGGYWTGLKHALRFDFLEGVDPWVVHLDDIKLTGDDTANASFMVRWSYPGTGMPTSLDFYASQNRNTCLTNGTLIHHWQPSDPGTTQPPAGPYRAYLPSILAPASSGPDYFVWNTATVAAAKYYICARASDEYNTFTTVSDTPVVISH